VNLRAAVLLGALAAAPVVAAAAAEPQGARALERVAPKYPPLAARQRLGGCVRVSFMLDADGAPQDVRIEEARPNGIFDAATVKAVRRWRFEVVAPPARLEQVITYRMGSPGPLPEGQAPDCGTRALEIPYVVLP
jgi:TonB family protein